MPLRFICATDMYCSTQYMKKFLVFVFVFLFRCGDSGHLARNCPQGGGSSSGGGGGGGGGGFSQMRCYNCNEVGHTAQRCPLEA